MIKKLPPSFLLVAVICLAFLVRVWGVATLPATLNRDEAALAYNAVLLKETGKDEWGMSWPLSLKSFGDYKLPGYPVILVGFFSILGNSDLVVRLPSVLAGTFLVLIGYLFSVRVLGLSKNYSLLLAILIAIQPVFFFYSRMAWEANVALSLFLTGVLLLLLKQQKHRMWVDFLGLVFILLSIFIYNTPLLLTPFLIPVIILWRGYRKLSKWRLPVIGLFIILVIGLVSFASLSQQKSGITIFSDESTWMKYTEYRGQLSGVSQKILGNKLFFFTQTIAQNYLETFGPRFLAKEGGGHPWHTIASHGHVLPIVYVFGWVGIVWATARCAMALHTKKLVTAKVPAFLLFFLLVTPLPAVITVDAPHATRSLAFFFFWMLIAVEGFSWTWRVFERNTQLQFLTRKHFFVGLAAVALAFQATLYFSDYFIKYPQQSAQVLKAGFDEAMERAETQAEGRKIAIVDESGYQYISAAWYKKMSPESFFTTIQRHLPDTIGFRYGYKVGPYRFIAAKEDRFPDETILVEWNKEQNTWEVKVL